MLQVIIGALSGIALFFILEDIFNIPLNDTIKSVIGLGKQMEGDESRINSSLEEIAKSVAKRIKLNEYKKAQMEADLRTARMNLTPERFLANCFVKAFVVGIFAIPAWVIWPILSLAILIISIVYYYNETRSLSETIAKKRYAIEFELSRLVATIEKTLRHSRDVMLMLDSYAEIAGPELQHELQITTSDMRSGNYETAIARLETRVGSHMMSDVCRGLISIMRGDETTMYWQSLSIKFEDAQREMLKAQANKIPRKVQRLSMVMLICFIVTWVVVICMQVVEALSSMFA